MIARVQRDGRTQSPVTVLVVDEPTAALDAKAEARVFQALGRAASHGTSDRITIVVTHRLANIKTADDILVLNHGRLVEQIQIGSS